MIDYEEFGQFWTNSDTFGQIWTNLDKFGQIQSRIRTRLCSPLLVSVRIRSKLSNFSQFRRSLVKFGKIRETSNKFLLVFVLNYSNNFGQEFRVPVRIRPSWPKFKKGIEKDEGGSTRLSQKGRNRNSQSKHSLTEIIGEKAHEPKIWWIQSKWLTKQKEFPTKLRKKKTQNSFFVLYEIVCWFQIAHIIFNVVFCRRFNLEHSF